MIKMYSFALLLGLFLMTHHEASCMRKRQTAKQQSTKNDHTFLYGRGDFESAGPGSASRDDVLEAAIILANLRVGPQKASDNKHDN